MKTIILLFSVVTSLSNFTLETETQEFQGQATYISKTRMELGTWGARMSEEQKKQMSAFKKSFGKDLCFKL